MTKPPHAGWRTRSLPLLAILLPWLTGCAVAGSCDSLVLRDYPPADRQRLADELAAAPSSAVWPRVVVDAAGLRDQVRACQAK
ncbi:hypothetical protein [Limobrevibacterium gyesilva]|uniref:Uncharacterized protein n=1 Tax=Limobrevibacterium gyesilva TaxID=2991712 RepID=A0AA41YNY1_9PROT|nr:hypothetical protein [Limobrevibacterium gyesilva]MCW3477381.1 hypothetical protein [Limobrevibacterium gyesilva]